MLPSTMATIKAGTSSQIGMMGETLLLALVGEAETTLRLPTVA